ncbi:MAG TPA: MFS transporter [Acidimicrobiales bacterium]|nr:MFS transporter [Acidimicrobiales bacterium]
MVRATAASGNSAANSRSSNEARTHAGMAVLCFVLFLTFLDNTVISATLSNVQSDLHAGVSQLQWVVSGYALTFASLMLMCGTLGDLYGRKKIMLIGVVVFCAGSVIGAVAQNTDTLIAGRVVMGIGAAASEPGTLSMIRHLYPEREDRARALGIWAAVSGLALALGPVIGGVLVGLWSWHAVFWFNVFFGIVAFVAAAIALPENSDPVRARLDFPGFVLGAVALGSATFATIAGETAGYRTGWIIALYGFAVVTLVAFILVERRAQNPVLDVKLFRRPPFAGANVVAFTTYFGVFSIFFFVALYLEEVGSQSPYSLALDFIPLTAGMIIASLLTGRWVAAWGAKIPMAVGCVLAGVGILLTDLVITPQAGLDTVGWTLAIAGIGFGIAIVPVTSSALSSVPSEHSGMAASATNTSRELGAVAGVAILGSVVNGQLTVNLIKRLNAIGIPHAFQSQVIAAVTTGAVGSQAKNAAHGNASIQAIVNKVVSAAYGAFAHGLDLSLLAAGALMLLSAILALFTGISRHSGSHRFRASRSAANDEPASEAS